MTLSDADRARIIEAIRQAETRTSGEIYCVFTRSSSGYRVFPLAWAAVVALLIPLPLIYLTAWPAGVIYALQLAGFLGALYGLTRETSATASCRAGPSASARIRRRCDSSRRTGFSTRSCAPAC